MRLRWPWWRCATSGRGPCAPRMTRSCRGCCRNDATTWLKNALGPRIGRTRCCAISSPGGAKRNLTADQAAVLLRGVRPVTAADTQRKQRARELLADLRRLDTALERNAAEIATAVAAHGTSITQIHDVGRSLPPRSWGTPARSRGCPAATTTPALLGSAAGTVGARVLAGAHASMRWCERCG
jgi:hypothetical protein